MQIHVSFNAERHTKGRYFSIEITYIETAESVETHDMPEAEAIFELLK